MLISLQLKNPMDNTLSSNKSAINDLSNLNNILKELVQLSNQDFNSLDECLLAYIRFGMDNTRFTSGMVSQIEGEKYTIIQAISWNKDLKKGKVVPLFDTLCKAAYQSGNTLFCADTEKNNELFTLPARSFLNISAIISAPLKINGSIYGSLTFCSETKVEDSNHWDFIINLVELLGQSLSKIIKEHLLQENLEAERKLLEMGSKLLKMGTYKRSLTSQIVTCTSSFYEIFELEMNPKKQLHSSNTFMSKVVESDKKIIDDAFTKSEKGDVPPFEYRMIRKDGTYKWLRHEIRCEPEKGFVLGIVQDITLLKNSLKELENKNKELEQFAYVAAHDLREPLQTIEGFSKILSSKYKSVIDEKGQELLSYLGEASIRMKNQINGLLTYSKIGRSGHLQEVDMNKLIKDIRSDFSFEIQESKAKIIFNQLPILKGYPVELRMLFQNIFSNAIKFKRKTIDPIINVKCQKFSIIDNGIGIAEENIQKIFDMFTRLNSSREFKGTGIGLAQCKKIINLHGGAITVHSKLNEGTTFEFSIKKR